MEHLRSIAIMGLMAFNYAFIFCHPTFAAEVVEDNTVVASYVLLTLPASLSVNDDDDDNDEEWDKETEPVEGENDTVMITVTAFSAFSAGEVTVSIDTGALDKIEGFWPGTLTIDDDSEHSTGDDADGKKKEGKELPFTFDVEMGKKYDQVLYIEGIKNSAALNDVSITVELVPEVAEYVAPLTKYTTVYQVDLDIDFDSYNEILEYIGADDPEDKIEASEKLDSSGRMRPGMIIPSTTQKNSDSDDIPDFADGFNLGIGSGITLNELANVSTTLKFVPVRLLLKEPFDPATAKVKFPSKVMVGNVEQPAYVVSIPQIAPNGDIELTGDGTAVAPYLFTLGKGGMRLWTKNAMERTSGEKVNKEVDEGDFVPADEDIAWSDLAGSSRTVTLYLEYVDTNPRQAAGRGSITVKASEGEATCEDKANVTLIMFNNMWETQNKANQIFNSTRKDDPIIMPSPQPDRLNSVHGVDTNHLYVVADSTDYKLGVTVDATGGKYPTQFVAAAYSNGSKVSGSDTDFPAAGPVNMRISCRDDLVIRVGYDANGNHILDTSEEIKFAMPAKFDESADGEPTVKGIDDIKYSLLATAADGVIALGGTIYNIAIPHTSEFLRLFRDGGVAGMPVNKRPTSSTSFTMDVYNGELCEWITHNAGASFSDAGIGDIWFRHWDATTSVATMTGNSYTIQTSIKSYFNTTIMPQVTTYFASLPPGAVADFPQSGVATVIQLHESTPLWVPKTTVQFDDPFLPNIGGDDAFGLIGRGRVPLHQAKFTVTKVEYDEYVGDAPGGAPIFHKRIGYDVVARTVGRVEDLYDFNYNAGGINEIGAALQLGYGRGTSGRTAGRIYRWDISWDETFSWFKN